MNISLITELSEKKKEVRHEYLKRLSDEELLQLKKYLALNDRIFFGETYIRAIR